MKKNIFQVVLKKQKAPLEAFIWLKMQYVFVHHEICNMQELRILHLYISYKFVVSHNILPNYLNLYIFQQYVLCAFFKISSNILALFLHYLLCAFFNPTPIGTKQWDPLSSSFHYEI